MSQNSPNKFNKIEIIQCILIDHRKIHRYVEINQYNQQIKEEIKREFRNYLETNENENTMYQNIWDVIKALLKVYSDR